MTVDKTIRTALEPFEYDAYHNTYTGLDEIYFVFNYNVVPDSYSDDEPEYNRYVCQVHLYAPMTYNSITIAKQVKLALENAGFTYPEQVDASDEDGQHLVFECEFVEYIERGDE